MSTLWGQGEPGSAPHTLQDRGLSCCRGARTLRCSQVPLPPQLHMCLARDKLLASAGLRGQGTETRGMSGGETQQAKAAVEPLEAEGQLRIRNEMGVG